MGRTDTEHGNIAAALALATRAATAAERTPANACAQIYFATLEDGATISGAVRVVFGLRGMGVAPGGTKKR